MLKINNNYSIDTAGGGCTLQFIELRERKKKDSNETETYTFKDEWHYLDVPSCLRRFLTLSLEDCTDVKECLKRIDEVEAKINKFPNQLPQK